MKRFVRSLLASLTCSFAMLLATASLAQVTVTATGVGPGPTVYANLTTAFAAINAGTHTLAITIAITASYAEPAGSAVLNSSGNGAASYTSVLIRPTGAGPYTVTGTPILGRGVIELNGADGVTINGDIAGGAVGRDLTITCASATTVNLTSVVRVAVLATLAVNGTADGNSISNCNINGNATGRNGAAFVSTTAVENSAFGIYTGGLAGATAGTAPSALTSVSTNTALAGTTINTFTVDNCAVNACARGIFYNGAATSVCAGTLTISNNLVGDQATDNTAGTPPFTAPTTTVYTKGIFVAGATTIVVTGNTLKNILSYVGTAMNAIELNSAIGSSVNVNSNTITTICQNTAASAVRAIIVSSAAGPTTNVNSNTIQNCNTVGASSVGAIDVTYSGTTTGSISKNSINRVRNRNTGGFGASGIRISGGSGWNINDNCIVEVLNIGSASFTGTFNAVGIKLAAGSNHKVYHNSVNLFGASTSIGSNSIACLEISASSQTGIDIRNNLLSNTVTGGAVTDAHVCLFTPFTNAAMTLTQNNNAYFCGSAAQQGMAFAGAATYAAANLYSAANFNAGATTPATNYRSVSTVLGLATNDNASFASTTAAPFTTPTNLHIPAATSTQLESGGVAGTGITTDFDGDTYGTLGSATAPDIGYDEFAGVAVDLTAPSISYTALGNTCALTGQSLTATITDASGVPTAGIGLPRLAYRINAGAYTYITATFGGGSSYSFTGIGVGVVAGDVVSYFVVAQDGAATPNVGTNPSAGAGGFSANPPTAGTAPTTPNSYTIGFTLGGTILVGAVQPVPYNTITGAVGRYNTGCLSSAVVFELTDATYPGETFPIIINANANASATNTLTIRPGTGVVSAISGSSASGMFMLSGADYVTIDGSNAPVANACCSTVSSRNMTITNTSVATTSGVVWLASSGANGVTNCTVKNCNIYGNAPTTTLVALGSGGATVGAVATAANNDITFENNEMRASQYGIYAAGVSAAVKNQNNVISLNVLTAAFPNNFAIGGIGTIFQNNHTISCNQISNVGNITTEGSLDAFAINAGMGFGDAAHSATATGTADGVSNVTISKNVIGDIVKTNTWGVSGISLGNTISGTSTISNNMIHGVRSNHTSPDIGAGIYLGGGTATIRVYYNTVSMQGTITGATAASQTSACLAVTAAAAPSALDIRDNIFSNTQIGNTGATSRLAAIALGYTSTLGNYSGLTSNNNDLYSVAAAPGTHMVGITGGVTAGTTRSTLADWTTETGRDAAPISKNVLPVFLGLTNLHLDNTNISNLTNLISSGTPVSVTDDIDCQTRTATPSMGADQTSPICLAPTATVGGSQTICALGTTPGLGGNNPSPGTGTWSVFSGGTGIFNPNVNDPNATFSHATGTGPLVLRWTITEAFCPTTSADVSITINQNPTTATVGGAQLICDLGTTTSLGGNTPGVGTGAWSVVSGGTGTFSNSASPTSTFTHVTGVGPVVVRWTISNAPCVASSADVTITINQNPTTATVGGPHTICALGSTTGLGGNVPSVGTGAWSVVSGGTGTFAPNSGDENATFTHLTGVGPVVVRWTISNAPCVASTADVTITINQNPTTATVGGPHTICDLGSTTGLGGNVPSVGTGAWSVVSGGTGTFAPNSGDENATFTHLTGVGPVVVRWTISNAPCIASTADVTITINQNPTTSAAGSDQSICTQPGSATMAANAPSVGAGTWTQVSGPISATITTPGSEITTITGMTTAGSYVFRWTIANAPCTDSQDDVTVVVGICAYYSRATGNVTDPIWSDTPAGTAGAATFTSSTSMIVQSPDVVTNTANVMVNNVTVDVGGTLVLTGGTTFTANGTTNAINGTLTANDNSALVLTGNVATTFAVVGTPSLWDLTIANLGGVTATGNIDIRGTLQLSYGNLNASAAAISLGSTATETGRLGPVGPTASYTGNMRIERHIPTGNADWRLLGSPITGRTVNDWAADFITAGFPGSAYPNFDNPVGSNILWPSIRWYDETDLGTGDNDGMTGVSSNLQALLPGQGFAAFVGDDFSTVNAFEIDLRNGAPVIASTPISLPMTYTNTGNAPVDGWNLVSNPLPSAIAFDQISRGADIGDQVTYYNPVTGNTGVWDISLNFGTNGATNTIQSMQGFFLKATGPAVTTTVDESDKVNSNAGGIFGTTNEVPAHLRLNLTSSINTYSDETVVLFAEGTPIMDVEDALKYVFANDESPQIASIAPTGEQFAINAYGAFPEGFTIPVSVNVAVSGTYTITLTEAGDVPMTCLVLEDTENGTFTVMDNGGTYSFEIDATDDETIARFILRASAPIAFSNTNALCGANPNGTASVDVPVGPADVIWTDDLNNQLLVQTGITGPASINDLGPGGYMVHVYTSTLCGELVRSFTIEAPFVLEAQGTTTDATCADTQNGTVDLIPLGGTTPYNFLWSDANSSSSEDLVALPGAYTVTITDANGCAWTSNAYVIGDQGPDGTFGTSATTVLVNVPVLFNGNDAGANYAWDFGDGSTSSEMAPAHSWTLPGVYTVTLTVTSGLCTVTTTVDITVDLNTGVTNVASSAPTHVWGTTQWIFVEHGYSSSDPLFIEVLDATGRLQNQRKVAAAPGRITLPAEGLSTGVWFVRLTCGDATETFRVPVVR